MSIMKVAILFALFAAASAGVLGGSSTVSRTDDGAGNYAFSYKESHATGGTFRTEKGGPGGVAGSYGLHDADGRLRTVNYVADGAGYRAVVSSNEPGVEAKDPADVAITKGESAQVVQVSSGVKSAPLVAAPAPLYAAVPASTIISGSGFTTTINHGGSSQLTAGSAGIKGGAATVSNRGDGAGNYAFSYNENHSGGGTFRSEQGSHGIVSGSYGLREADGRFRTVNYLADAAGYRASISSNEPGVEAKNPADVTINKAAAVIAAPVVAAPVPAPLYAPAAAALIISGNGFSTTINHGAGAKVVAVPEFGAQVLDTAW